MPEQERPRVFVVDDSPENLHLMVGILAGITEVTVATSGKQCLERLAAGPRPDLILLDVVMPGMDGFAVCRLIKADPATHDIPILFITSLDSDQDEVRALELGAVDFITKPFHPAVVRQRVRNQLELKLYRDRLESLVERRTAELELTKKVTIMGLGALAEFRDPETGGHIQRTSNYVRIIAEVLATLPAFRDVLPPSRITWLSQSAPLHDIGKVGIRDEILLKPAKLTDAEFAVMRTHCYIGYRALKAATVDIGTTSFLDMAMDMAYSHHERWNGQGYPRRLSGDDIPLAGRLMSLADVYDALRSERPYKSAFTHAETRRIILDEMEGYFDPRVVTAFLERERDFEDIAQRFQDEPA